MSAIPSLPSGGPLRLLAIAGSISLLALLVTVPLQLRRRSNREAAWAAAALAMSLVSFGLGRIIPAIHPFASGATLVLSARNMVRFDGTPRALQAVAFASWVIAIVSARRLFGK